MLTLSGMSRNDNYNMKIVPCSLSSRWGWINKNRKRKNCSVRNNSHDPDCYKFEPYYKKCAVALRNIFSEQFQASESYIFFEISFV